MNKPLMAAALIVFASPAFADSFVRTSNCNFSGYYGYHSCRTVWSWIPDPVRDRKQERLDALARKQEDAKWEAFCKPKFHLDQYGIHRASYAKQGCEFGRTE